MSDMHDATDLTEGLETAEVPCRLEELPDGREAVVIGEPAEDAGLNHLQGDNPEGYMGTCGLVSCEQVLNQFGVNVTEADLVRYAVENGQCISEGSGSPFETPATLGGTTPFDQARILTEFGVPAHVEVLGTLEDVASAVEEGRGVILEVNSGVLWQDLRFYDWGQPNHAVTVTGAARDPLTGDLMGVFINDSGTGESGKLVDAATLETAWAQAGGVSVETDLVR